MIQVFGNSANSANYMGVNANLSFYVTPTPHPHPHVCQNTLNMKTQTCSQISKLFPKYKIDKPSIERTDKL